MVNVYPEVYKVNIDSDNPESNIPSSLGLTKGDLIVFAGENAPVRFPSGNTPDKIMLTDPTSPTGWRLGDIADGGGGGGGAQTVTLINNSGSTILAGTVVIIDKSAGEREIRKAKKTDSGTLFITATESQTGNTVECYCIPNTICSVICTNAAVAVGDYLALSSIDGLAAKSTTSISIGIALTSKPSGSVGYVKVLLNCFFDFTKYRTSDFTVSTSDLEDGVSALTTDHFWYYYESNNEGDNSSGPSFPPHINDGSEHVRKSL